MSALNNIIMELMSQKFVGFDKFAGLKTVLLKWSYLEF